MSATTTPAVAVGSPPINEPEIASPWIPRNERPPTEQEEARARERSLNVGNETEIGYDAEVNHYDARAVPEAVKERYERLDRHNRDNHWEYREDVDVASSYDRQLKLKSTLAIASQLGLSPYQKQVVVDRMFEIDGQRFGQQTEVVAFCLCAVVVNEEAECRRDTEKPYHPARNDENNEQEFVRIQNQLIDAFGAITKTRLQSVYGKVTQGNPPLVDDEETRQFVRMNTNYQRRPSFAPDHSLARPTGEA